MPVPTVARQPDAAQRWLASPHGQAVLHSEWPSLHAALAARPGLPWVVFSAVPRPDFIDLPHGLWLCDTGRRWQGEIDCGLPLPLASESVGAIVIQHVECASHPEWLAECARLLVPGGRLAVFVLNPLSPFRAHWQFEGAHGREPITWRRRLKRAGLVPDPVAQGIGPRWRSRIEATPQLGAGARAAWLLSAEKRQWPLTPRRQPVLGPALGESA